MLKSKRARKPKKSSLSRHIFWGAISGVATVWVTNKYLNALPDEAREAVDKSLDQLSPSADTQTAEPDFDRSPDQLSYVLGAGVGALYGISTFYFPVLRHLRKALFGALAWSFRVSKLASMAGILHDSKHRTLSERAMALASRRAYKYALDQSFRRAER